MTNEERERFLRELAISGNLTFACLAASVNRAEAYAERFRNPLFEAEWRRATALAVARFSERLRLAA